MRKKQVLRKTLAALTAGVMMIAMGISALAEGETDAPKNVTITKEITKEANVYAPSDTFEFTITPGTAVSAGEGQDAIYAGPADGAEISGKIVSSPKASDIGAETITAGTCAITIHESAFTAPGIYRYVVAEKAGKYEGVVYSTEEKYFDVYVNKDNQVYSYAFVDKEDQKAKDDGVFTNDYGRDQDTLHDLTIEKTVEGLQGDKTKGFEFTIGVTGAQGEQYYVTAGSKTLTLNSGETKTITLADGETATIYGLSAGDTYTVKETSYADDGYQTTIDGTVTNEATGTIQTDKTLSVINTKEAATPTGLVMNIAPYILMVAAAILLAVVFLRRRKETV